MQFRDFIKKALGSEARVKVLLYLFKDKTPTSEREIARLLGLSHSAVNKIMKDFQDVNLIASMRIGTAQVWRLNEKSYAYWALQDLGRLAKWPPVEHLKEYIISPAFRAYPGVKKVVIFGSLAEGRESPSSDIDLFILVESEDIKKTILERLPELADKCLQLYGNALSPHLMTEKEAQTSENKIIIEAIRKGLSVI